MPRYRPRELLLLRRGIPPRPILVFYRVRQLRLVGLELGNQLDCAKAANSARKADGAIVSGALNDKLYVIRSML